MARRAPQVPRPPLPPQPRLPPLLAPGRRRLLVLAVGIAVVRAGLAIGLALLVGMLVAAPAGRTAGVGLLVVAVLAATGGTAYAARVLAERLAQDYVHELRGRVVGAALGGGGARSLGITIARATNDLTAVRAWVADGIAPLVAALPLVVGSLGLLGALHPRLALAAGVPVVLLLAVALALVPQVHERARRLRRRRGRLASRVTDTLAARDGIAAAGGEERELRRVGTDSRRVADAAVARARTAGLLQAAALVAAGSVAVLVVAVARADGLAAATVATALTVAGSLATPLVESGRVAELAANAHAARRVLAPHLGPAEPYDAEPYAAEPHDAEPHDAEPYAAELHDAEPYDAEPDPVRHARPADVPGQVVVPGLLRAVPGDRWHVTGPDAAAVSAALLALARPGDDAGVTVDGRACARVSAGRRRRLVGLAASGVPLERGTVERAVRYRLPSAPPAATATALGAVGLTEVVAALPRGARTELRRGGEPLAPPDVARLKVARAALGEPPLLLLDRVDADLDAEGRERLRDLVDDYPGVVLFASSTPHAVASRFDELALPTPAAPRAPVAR